VLLLVAASYRNVEIGGRLNVGDEPVKTHVSRILAKFDLGAACRSWSTPTATGCSRTNGRKVVDTVRGRGYQLGHGR
jgi:hypothetical protein